MIFQSEPAVVVPLSAVARRVPRLGQRCRRQLRRRQVRPLNGRIWCETRGVTRLGCDAKLWQKAQTKNYLKIEVQYGVCEVRETPPDCCTAFSEVFLPTQCIFRQLDQATSEMLNFN